MPQYALEALRSKCCARQYRGYLLSYRGREGNQQIMQITCNITDGIALLQMDDGKKNAITLAALKELHEAFSEAESNADVIVIAGRPGAFCAGFELTAMTGEDREMALQLGKAGGQLATRLYGCGKPLVAACTGHAFTIGLLWMLACDTRIGARGAYKFGMTETALGALLTPWTMELLQSRLAPTHFVPITVQSKILGPEEAVTAGFLDKLVDDDQVLQAALSAAHELQQLPAKTYSINKLAVREAALERMRVDLSD